MKKISDFLKDKTQNIPTETIVYLFLKTYLQEKYQFTLEKKDLKIKGYYLGLVIPNELLFFIKNDEKNVLAEIKKFTGFTFTKII